MHTTHVISALASAALLFGAAPTAASAQTSTMPPMQMATPPITAPTTPTKAPADIATPVAAPTPGTATGGTPGVLGALALDARYLRARRTSTGYTLSGQALVNDACQAARFDPSLLTIYPPQYNLTQFRDPRKKNMMCVQRLIWVTAVPRRVSSTKPPPYITVRTNKGAKRVNIL